MIATVALLRKSIVVMMYYGKMVAMKGDYVVLKMSM